MGPVSSSTTLPTRAWCTAVALLGVAAALRVADPRIRQRPAPRPMLPRSALRDAPLVPRRSSKTTTTTTMALVESAVPTAVAVNTAAAALGIAAKQKVLTPAGLAHGWFLGVILWSSFLGWRGYATCVLYLVLGSAVTKVRQRQKEAEGIAEKRGGARGPENVWGSALTAALCALAGTAIPALASAAWRETLAVAFVASLATKLADTTQSEIGKAYGRRTYLSTTFEPVPRGTEGAVSMEGTLAGFVASVAITGFAAAVGLLEWASPALVVCVFAAFVATTAESVLGATLQGRVPWLTNEFVNVINTLIGAVVAGVLWRNWAAVPGGAAVLVGAMLAPVVAAAVRSVVESSSENTS
mmetsp:Transcript_4455/g.18113  ORF Transcript_4455/g.18113 Transcript_4455/m.18113 type:complete len:356 (+) Transcript_4455:15-1082(+)